MHGRTTVTFAFRRLFQPTQLVRIADGVDPGDQVILDHQTHRGVVASDI